MDLTGVIINPMLKLNESNASQYLKDLNIFEDVDWESVSIQEVKENTNVNFVFFADLNSKRYKRVFFKQSFDFVKVNPNFPAPIERQLAEKKSIDYLQQYWKGRIPEVIHYDSENNVLIITDVGENAVLLANEIKNGNLHFEIGTDLGKMMAELHTPTYDMDDYPVRNAKENDEHVDFIFDFRLRGARQEAPEETNKLFIESGEVKTSMIYGDWASKNVFVAGDKVRLVDFENLVRYDPAFDIGYALAHWVLDISKENIEDMTKFFEDFENAYSLSWNENYKEDLASILQRSARYTGAMMLHRLAGVKNTNRMEEYLNRDIDLIKLAKDILENSYVSPSATLKSLNI
jgi:5-methylthioribose kinase